MDHLLSIYKIIIDHVHEKYSWNVDNFLSLLFPITIRLSNNMSPGRRSAGTVLIGGFGFLESVTFFAQKRSLVYDETSMSRERGQLYLRTDRGQHFILDTEAIIKLVDEIPEGATVIEVGAGNGRLTRALAQKFREVIAIEDDERFREDLLGLARRNKNVRVIIDNALNVDFSQYDRPWVVGNVPFHITEPLATKMARSGIRGATLMVGSNFANEISSSEDSGGVLGRLGMLVTTFFSVKRVADIDKHSFEPIPRTNAVIMTLVPRIEAEISADQIRFLLHELFSEKKEGAKLKNALMEALIKREPRMTQNDARKLISDLGIPRETLEKSMAQLNNDELSILYRALMNVK